MAKPWFILEPLNYNLRHCRSVHGQGSRFACALRLKQAQL